jgi:threonine/homoserine/homoserine lactone efflux protein
MSDFMDGLGLGLILQISVGPVFVAILHKGLTQGFRHAYFMVWGVALVDSLYILVSMLGVSALLQIGPMRVVLGIAGALLLAYFGIRYLRAPASVTPIERCDASLLGSFTFGAGLTLTNPLTILFWVGIMGGIRSSRTFRQGYGALWFATGCITATLLFLTLVALTGDLLERVVSEQLVLWLNRAAGIFLLGFAGKLAVDLMAKA